MAVGDIATASNFRSGGGSSASSALVRQRSSPAGFLSHQLASASDNGTRFTFTFFPSFFFLLLLHFS
jgi:hypothetical protein